MAMSLGRALAVGLLVLGLSSGVSGLYEPSGPVKLLTQRSFSKVLESQLPVVVEFFAPWCGHCKALAPAFTRAAEKLSGIVAFVAVDCDAEKNRGLCGQYGVQGFPTIKLFRSGKAAPTDHQGERSAKALVEAATAMLTAKHVKSAGSDADAEAFLQGGPAGPKVLLFSDKPKPSPLYKSLSTRFQPKLAFAEVSPKAKETAARFGVTSLPTLVVVGADGQHETYQGELKAASLIDYLKKVALGGKAEQEGRKSAEKSEQKKPKEGGRKEEEGEGKAEGGRAEQEPSSKVASLPHLVKSATLGELEADVLSKDGVVVLALYTGDNETCADKLTQLNQVVHGLRDLAKGVQVQLENAEEVAAAAKLVPLLDKEALLAGQGCPMQIFLLPYKDKDEADDWKKFEGELTSKELHKALLGVFTDAFVTPIDATTQQNWLLQDPTRVKVLLFSDKEEVPGVMRALSCNFRDYKMDFGMAAASDEKIMKQFGVKKVPHLLLAFPRPEGSADRGLPPGPPETARATPIAIQAYEGPMRYANIAFFLKFASIQLGVAPKEVMEELQGAGQPAPTTVPKSVAAVRHLASQEDLEEVCLDKDSVVCIIAVLPPQQAQQDGGAAGAAAPALSLELAVMQRVAALSAARGEAGALAFCWVDGIKHRSFARAVGVSTPGVVALAASKQRYAVMPGVVLLDTLEQFVQGLLSAKVPTTTLQEVPELKEEPEEEEEAVVVEEEFDLADIMKEEVEGEVASKKEEQLAAEREAAHKKKAAGGKKKGSKKKKKKAKKGSDEL